MGVVFVLAGPASAGDADAFKGLIPGVPLKEADLGELYGKGPGGFTFTLDNGSLFSLDGSVDLSQTANQVGNTSNNSGITTPIQFVGDHNVVNVTVKLDVNIGTVSVSDLSGTSVNVNQAVSLSGGFDLNSIGR